MNKLTLNQAQTLLHEDWSHQRWDRHPKQKVALLVGIDAIERVKAYREQRLYISMMPLEGELLF